MSWHLSLHLLTTPVMAFRVALDPERSHLETLITAAKTLQSSQYSYIVKFPGDMDLGNSIQPTAPSFQQPHKGGLRIPRRRGRCHLSCHPPPTPGRQGHEAEQEQGVWCRAPSPPLLEPSVQYQAWALGACSEAGWAWSEGGVPSCLTSGWPHSLAGPAGPPAGWGLAQNGKRPSRSTCPAADTYPQYTKMQRAPERERRTAQQKSGRGKHQKGSVTEDTREQTGQFM